VFKNVPEVSYNIDYPGGLARIKVSLRATSRPICNCYIINQIQALENFMTWETPTATDIRFGFEVTMYIGNR